MIHAVDIKNLSKIINNTVILDDISLSIEKGSIAGIIGRSGAGKTTLLRCLSGLEAASSGTIHLLGQDIASKNKKNTVPIQQKIGVIFQQFNLLSRRTVFENVAFPLEIRGFSQTLIQERVTHILDLVGLTGKECAYPRELSGGQCQRVAIARSLVVDTVVLLCDEFTSALDPDTTLDILELLKNINKHLGVTVILITHDMTVVKEICDTVFVLEKGQCVEKGSMSTLLLHPIHETTQSLIGSLFKRELPHSYEERLVHEPLEGSQIIVRLLFSNSAAKEPIIASLVEKFHLPINIISGHLDHVREAVFGQLLMSFPYTQTIFDDVQSYLNHYHVKTECVGYIRD